MCLNMPFFVSNPLVYVPDPLVFFIFKYLVTCVQVGGSGMQFSRVTVKQIA